MDFGEIKGQIDAGLLNKDLILIVGNCKVDYFGRATSKLPPGKRLVMIKGDGSISIHQNRLVRPTNYMMGSRIGSKISEESLTIYSNKTKPPEKLSVEFTEIHEIKRHEMEISNDLRLSGSERDLNEILMDDLSMIEPGLKPIDQQHHFRKGIADIIAQDKEGNFVVVELKRRQADFASVTQLHRYMKEVENMKNTKTRGILLAPDIRKNAKELLEQLGLEFSKLDFELMPNENKKAVIKGIEPKQQTLADHFKK